MTYGHTHSGGVEARLTISDNFTVRISWSCTHTPHSRTCTHTHTHTRTHIHACTHTRTGTQLRQEVEGVTARLRYLSEAHGTVRNDIALTKRASEKATTDVSRAQDEKLKQVSEREGGRKGGRGEDGRREGSVLQATWYLNSMGDQSQRLMFSIHMAVL